MCVSSVSHVHSAIPWTAAHWVPLSMGFSRQEYWSGLPFLPVGDLPNPVIEPPSPVSPTLAGRLYHWATWEAHIYIYISNSKTEYEDLFYKVPEICHMYSLSKKDHSKAHILGQHDYQLLVPDCSGGYTWPEAFSQQTECGLLWKDELS